MELKTEKGKIVILVDDEDIHVVSDAELCLYGPGDWDGPILRIEMTPEEGRRLLCAMTCADAVFASDDNVRNIEYELPGAVGAGWDMEVTDLGEFDMDTWRTHLKAIGRNDYKVHIYSKYTDTSIEFRINGVREWLQDVLDNGKEIENGMVGSTVP